MQGTCWGSKRHREQWSGASKANFNQLHKMAFNSFIFALHYGPGKQGLLSSPFDIMRKLRPRGTEWLLWGGTTDDWQGWNWRPGLPSPHLDSVHGPYLTLSSHCVVWPWFIPAHNHSGEVRQGWPALTSHTSVQSLAASPVGSDLSK